VRIIERDDDIDDSGSFDAFYRTERASVIRFIWLLTRDPSTTEDVAHEAFAAVYRRFGDLDQPRAYLRRVIVNRIAERARRSDREERRIRLAHAGAATQVEGPSGGIADAIALLPLRQRTAVVLRYWSDLDDFEIAAALGCRPGTVRSLLSRATARLRKDFHDA